MLIQAIRGAYSFTGRRPIIRFLAAAPRAPSAILRAELANGQDFVGGLVYDFETTSADPSSAEAVQMAVMCVNSKLSNPPSFVRYVLPTGPIEPGAEAVHGISRELLIAQGAQPFPIVYRELREWLSTTFGDKRPLVWTAHNGHMFDEPIFRRLVGQSLPDHWRFYDTLLTAQEVVDGGLRPWGKGQFTLGRLYLDATGKPLEGAHDAVVDCSALASVWKWLAVQERSTHLSNGTGGGNSKNSDMKALFQTHLQNLGYSSAGTKQSPMKAPPGGWVKRTGATPSSASPKPSKPRQATTVSSTKVLVSDIAANTQCLETLSLSELPGVGPVVEAKLSASMSWVSVSCAVAHFNGPFCDRDSSAFKEAVSKALQKRATGQPRPLSQMSARTAAKRLAEFCEAHHADRVARAE